LFFTKGGVFLYEKFETLLHKKGITAYRASLDTKIAQSTFSDWKSGRSKPKADKLLILAKYFGVPVEFFLEGESE
jgi:transcriptional regulator with XRE-family HTH domain